MLDESCHGAMLAGGLVNGTSSMYRVSSIEYRVPSTEYRVLSKAYMNYAETQIEEFRSQEHSIRQQLAEIMCGLDGVEYDIDFGGHQYSTIIRR